MNLRRTFNSVERLESRTREQIPSINDLLDDPSAIISEWKENHVRVPFSADNLKNMESMMSKGLKGGKLYFLGGIPSSGKSMLVNNIADNICMNDHPVLLFSFDDCKEEIRYRTFARFNKYSIHNFNDRSLTESDLKAITNDPNIQKIQSVKYICEKQLSIHTWSHMIDEIKERHNKSPVIIVDYLKKIQTKKKTSEERLRIDDIVYRLSETSEGLQLPNFSDLRARTGIL